MKKRFLVLMMALVAVCLFALTPQKAEAATIVDSGTCGDNLTWTLDSEGTLTISGTGAMVNDSILQDFSSVNSVIIDDGVTSIGDWAFYGGSSLTSVTIPDSVISIGDYAFSDCDSLTSIIIPNSVTSIGDCAFYDCSSLTSITIPDGVTSIGEWVFSDCDSLASIIIPNSVTSIGDYAFYDCDSLTSIIIPNSVTSIGNEAFYGCYSLTSITIPHSVTSIGDFAFDFCYSLTGIWVDENNTVYTSDSSGVLFNKSKDLLIQAPPSGMSGDYVIPNSVTGIGSHAFNYCTSLTSITIPDSVTSIGSSAFRDCTSLTSITIPDSVTSIGSLAFYYCTGLTSITIPDSVTSIGDFAFHSCDSLTGIWVDENNTAYASDSSGVLFNKSKDLLIQAPSSGISGDYVIPNSVTSIGEWAFHSCICLTSITIPNSVTSIGDYAFYECYDLTSITIPDGVTSIGNGAFTYCSSLTSITIPDSVTSIGDDAFFGCDSLTSITIGNSVTSIGSYGFYSCDSLTSITIPDSVTSVGDWAFYDCDSLTDVYYGGSEEQWNAITIGFNNEELTNATIHFAKVDVMEDANAKFSTTGLSLGEFIGLQSAVVKKNLNGGNFDEAYFVYTHHTFDENGNPIEVTERAAFIDAGNFFVADCKVNAKQMSDVFEITPYYVVDGVTYYGTTTTTSVKAEVMKLLAKSTTDDKTEALCVAMLNYGAEAQKKFAYNLDNLANAELSASQKVLPTFADLNLKKNNTIPTTPYKPGSSGLSLSEVVYMQFLMPMSKVDANGELQYQILGEDLVKIKVSDLEIYGSYYVISIPIKAKNVRSNIYIGLYNAQGVRDYGYMICSVEAFAKTLQGSVNETLVAALMAYGDAAKAVFSNN